MFLLGSYSYAGYTQSIEGTVTVDARQDLLSVLPEEVSYFLPRFEDAYVMFKDGTSSMGKVNICLVDNSVRHINSNGDTLLLANQDRVQRVLVADTVLLYAENAFVKQLMVYGQLSISERRRLELDKRQEVSQGAYGSLPPTSTAVTGNLMLLDPTRKFDARSDISYSFKVDYVLTDRERIYPAGRKSFTRLFPEHKKEINAYIKNHRTNFKDPRSLVELFYYCTEL